MCAPLQAIGDELLDSIVSDNIPIWTEEERYNQTVLSSVERIEAQLTGKEVPGEAGRQQRHMTVLSRATAGRTSGMLKARIAPTTLSEAAAVGRTTLWLHVTVPCRLA